MAQVLKSLPATWEPREALSWEVPNPGCCRHWGSERVHGRPVSLHPPVTLCLSNNYAFTKDRMLSKNQLLLNNHKSHSNIKRSFFYILMTIFT